MCSTYNSWLRKEKKNKKTRERKEAVTAVVCPLFFLRLSSFSQPHREWERGVSLHIDDIKKIYTHSRTWSVSSSFVAEFFLSFLRHSLEYESITKIRLLTKPTTTTKTVRNDEAHRRLRYCYAKSSFLQLPLVIFNGNVEEGRISQPLSNRNFMIIGHSSFGNAWDVWAQAVTTMLSNKP